MQVKRKVKSARKCDSNEKENRDCFALFIFEGFNILEGVTSGFITDGYELIYEIIV